MTGYVVCRTADIGPNQRLLAEVADREIAIFNVDGEYHAVRNKCPHMGGPLCRGHMVAELRSEQPGQYEHGDSRNIIRCPWHQWEFDVRTGQSWVDRRLRTPFFPVTVESGGDICDGLTPEQFLAANPDAEGLVKGPYVAETYPVDIDGEYVVVHIK